MAKRIHLTELGCIACEELSELDAGKEGWLVNNPNLLVAAEMVSRKKNASFWDQMSRKGDAEDSGSLYQRLPYQIWNVNKSGVCGSLYQRLPYQIWNVNKSGVCVTGTFGVCAVVKI